MNNGKIIDVRGMIFEEKINDRIFYSSLWLVAMKTHFYIFPLKISIF